MRKHSSPSRASHTPGLHWSRRSLALLLTLSMCLSLMPTAVFADDASPAPQESIHEAEPVQNPEASTEAPVETPAEAPAQASEEPQETPEAPVESPADPAQEPQDSADPQAAEDNQSPIAVQAAATAGDPNHTEHDETWIEVSTNEDIQMMLIRDNESTKKDGVYSRRAFNFYLTTDLKDVHFTTYPFQDVTICLNSHTITMGSSSTSFIYVGPSSTLNICDHMGSGAIVGASGRSDPLISVIPGNNINSAFYDNTAGGVFNLYSGTIRTETGSSATLISDAVHNNAPVGNYGIRARINIYGGKLENSSGGKAVNVGIYTNAKITGGEIKGHVNVSGYSDSVLTIEPAGGSNLTIDGNVSVAGYSGALNRINNTTITGELYVRSSGGATLNNCKIGSLALKVSQDVSISNVTTAQENSIGIVTNGSVTITNSTTHGNVRSEGNTTISDSTVNGDVSSKGNLSISGSTVNGTAQTDTKDSSLSLSGTTNIDTVKLKDGQQIKNGGLTGGTIGVDCEGSGSIIDNTGGLSGVTFNPKGSTTLNGTTATVSEDHSGTSYTSLSGTATKALSTGYYYINTDQTFDVTVASGQKVTLCLHNHTLTGNITVDQGGTLNLTTEKTRAFSTDYCYGQIIGHVVNNGTMDVLRVGVNNSNSSVPAVQNNGIMTINGVDFQSNGSSAVVNTGTMKSVSPSYGIITIKSNSGVATFQNNGSLDLNVTIITNTGTGEGLHTTKGMTFKGGVSANGVGVYINTDETVTFDSSAYVSVRETGLTSKSNAAIVIDGGAQVTMDSVTVNGGASGADSKVIWVKNGSLTANGFNVILKTTTADAGVYLDGPNASLRACLDNRSDVKTYGVVNNGGTVSLDGNVDFAVKNSGILNIGSDSTRASFLTKNDTTVPYITMTGGTASFVNFDDSGKVLNDDFLDLQGGTATFFNGEISMASGKYGVRVSGSGELILSGSVNLSGAPIYLASGKTFQIDSNATAAIRASVAMEAPDVFANNVDSKYKDCFFGTSDGENNYNVVYDSDNKTLSLTKGSAHIHDGQTYTALDTGKLANLADGYYFLNGDITSAGSETTVPANTTATICLNGFTLSTSFVLEDGASLTILGSEDGKTGTLKAVSDSNALVKTRENSSFTMTGGTVAGGSVTRNSIINGNSKKATVNFSGSTFTDVNQMLRNPGVGSNITLADCNITTTGRDNFIEMETDAAVTLTNTKIDRTTSGNTYFVVSAGTLSVTGGTIINNYYDGYIVELSGGLADFQNVTAKNTTTGHSIFDVTGGTLKLSGGTYANAATNYGMFSITGGEIQLNGGTYTMGSDSTTAKRFYDLVGKHNSSDTAIATGGTITLGGNPTFTIDGKTQVPFIPVNGVKLNLAEDLDPNVKIRLETDQNSVTVSDQAWTDARMEQFELPTAHMYELAVSEGTTILHRVDLGHKHSDSKGYAQALNQEAVDNIQSQNHLTLSDISGYLVEDVTLNGWIALYGPDQFSLCLNGHSINCGALDYSDLPNSGSIVGGDGDEGRGTINGSVYAYKYPITMKNVDVIGSEDYDYALKAGVVDLDDVKLTSTKSGSAALDIQVSNETFTIKDSTITGPEDGYAVKLNSDNTLKLVGTVNITGGKGVWQKLYSCSKIDASKLNSDSHVVVTYENMGTSACYRTVAINVSPEVAACFVNGDPENTRLVYDQDYKNIKLYDVRTYDFSNNDDVKAYNNQTSVRLDTTYKNITRGGSVTLTASVSYNDYSSTSTECPITNVAYNWYKTTGRSPNRMRTLVATTVGTPTGKQNGIINNVSYTIEGITEDADYSVEATYLIAYPGTASTQYAGSHKLATISSSSSSTAYVIVTVNDLLTFDTSSIVLKGITDGQKAYDGQAVTYSGNATATYGEGSTYLGPFNYDYYQKSETEGGADSKLSAAPTSAGSYYLRITSTNSSKYPGEAIIPFTITKKDINDITFALPDATYTGSQLKPTQFTIIAGGLSLEKDKDYQITGYGENINAGLGSVMVEGLGNFTGTKTVGFSISPKYLTDSMVTNLASSYPFVGNDIQPSITVIDGGTTLTQGTDFTVGYANNKDVGTATVKILGRGNYIGTIDKTFTITPWDLTNDSGLSVTIPDQTYTGSALTPDPVIKIGETQLVKGQDYTLSYVNNVNAGIAKVTITFQGNYAGSRDVSFTINPKPISDSSVSFTIRDVPNYNGQAQTPSLNAVDYGPTPELPLTEGTDYKIIDYKNNINASDDNAAVEDQPTIVVEGLGNYAGTRNVTFPINAKNIYDDDITVDSIPDQTYTGNTIKPKPVVKFGGTMLMEGTDYTLSYSVDSISAGSATVIIEGMGNFGGKLEKNFVINPVSFETSPEQFTIDPIPDQTYTGNAITPEPVVKFGTTTLKEGTDYTLSYENNVNAGTGKVIITFEGNYSGSKDVSFPINPKPIDSTGVTVDSIPNKTYTGKAITPKPVVKDGTTTLVEGTDYTLSYENNVSAGTEAKVTITGKGNYTGAWNASFKINPKPINAASITVDPISEQTYTGNAITPKPVVKDGTTTLVEGTDYILSYANNDSVSDQSATIYINGKGNYDGLNVAYFRITPKFIEMSDPVVSDIPNQTYTGSPLTPKPEVSYSGTILEEGKDYTLHYEDNVNAGAAGLRIMFQGNYAGMTHRTFYILPADQTLGKTDMTATYGQPFQVAPITGSQGKVIYKVKSDSTDLLRQNDDGTFTALSGTGTATIVAAAAGSNNYHSAAIEIPVTLTKATLTATAEDKSMYTYTALPTDLTVSYTGFVNGDTQASVVVQSATASIAAGVDGKTVGNYEILPADDTLLQSGMENNYTITLKAGTLTVSYPLFPFTDVSESDWFYDSIKWAVNRNITKGTADTTYSPSLGCTRAQIVTFLWRAAGEPEPTITTSPFTDVAQDQAHGCYYKAILWAYENGITKGTSATTFSPDQVCTRAQIVTFLYRSVGEPAPASTSMAFTDVPQDQYYYNAVLWAYENGIAKGMTATQFVPDDTCTRAQSVTFVYRATGVK